MIIMDETKSILVWHREKKMRPKKEKREEGDDRLPNSKYIMLPTSLHMLHISVLIIYCKNILFLQSMSSILSHMQNTNSKLVTRDPEGGLQG